MTRRLFGGETSVIDELGNVFSNQANKGNVWDADSGGSAVIDLTDVAGALIVSVSTDAHGQYKFYGPDDGTSKLWVDFGFGRFLTEATDTTNRLDGLEQAVADFTSISATTALVGDDGFILDTEQASGIPYIARRVGGVWQPRAFYTGDATRTIIWRSAVDPTISGTYALADVDMWIDGNGALWIAGADGQWHGGSTTGGTTGPTPSAALRTTVTMGVAGITGGTATGVLFGTSPGGTGSTRMSTTVAAFGPNYVRTFEGTPTTWGSNSQGQYVPAGVPQCNSIKPDMATLGNSSASGYAAMVTQYRTYYVGMPDIPGQRACAHHEPEGTGGAITDGAYTAAQFRQAQINFATDIIAFVNLSRTNPITATTILQGYTLQTASGRSVSNYVDSTVLAAVHEIGFDIYNAAQISLAVAWAAANSVAWSIPEYGYSTSTMGTDAQQKSFMTANTPGLKTLSNPPQYCCWFNGLVTQIATYQTANSSVGATTVTVDHLPGTMPSGSAVTIDSTGTADAVSTNASSPNPTLHVPALAHAHSTGAVVLVMPLSCAQWKTYCT